MVTQMLAARRGSPWPFSWFWFMLSAMRSVSRTPSSLVWLIWACVTLAGGARAQDEAPTVDFDAESGGNFLFIPGIGKIPLPPGARGFGPGNDPASQGLGPRQYGPKAAAPAPPPPKTPEQRQADEMDRLYARLAAAEDARDVIGAASAIQRHWSRSGSETIDLLAARAFAAQAGGAGPLARSLLDYVVALSPYWPEGFVRRARLRAALGDETGALEDFERGAQIDPRRFDALQAIGGLAEKLGDKKRALDAYRRALAITPREEALRKTEERLKIEVEGRDI